MNLTEEIREYAFTLGFNLVGFTSADSFDKADEYFQQWLKNGYAGEMKYMDRTAHKRANPQETLPGAKSIISLAMNYYQPDNPNLDKNPYKGKIAKYARGTDYHDVIQSKLSSLEKFIHTQVTVDIKTKSYVDTGHLLEREIAQRAGLGFIGKNTNLITRKFGSWVFLSEILTTCEFDYDKLARGTCGTCTLCIEACPTQAIVGPNQLDSRLCISYLTIELRNAIPEKLRPLMHNWIFGCDICQDVCPFNHKPKTTDIPELLNQSNNGTLSDLKTLLLIREDKEFKEKFKQSPMNRPKKEGIIRNAIIVAANNKATSLLPELQEIKKSDSSQMVRSHAQWAIEKLM